MTFSVEMLITLVTVVGGVLAIYVSVQKIQKQVVSEALWRRDIDNTLHNLTEKVEDLLTEHKDNARITRELREAKITIEAEVKKISKEQQTTGDCIGDLKKRILELELETAKNRGTWSGA